MGSMTVNHNNDDIWDQLEDINDDLDFVESVSFNTTAITGIIGDFIDVQQYRSSTQQKNAE